MYIDGIQKDEPKLGTDEPKFAGSNGDATPSCLSGSDGKEPACSAGDPGSIPGLGRSPGEENGNPLQYSSLENPMDRGAGRATVHGVIRSQT